MKRDLLGGFPFFGFVWSQYAQNTRVNAAAKSFPSTGLINPKSAHSADDSRSGFSHFGTKHGSRCYRHRA